MFRPHSLQPVQRAPPDAPGRTCFLSRTGRIRPDITSSGSSPVSSLGAPSRLGTAADPSGRLGTATTTATATPISRNVSRGMGMFGRGMHGVRLPVRLDPSPPPTSPPPPPPPRSGPPTHTS